MSKLNKKEKEAIDCTVELWDSILKLEVIHPDDVDEFRRDIHNIQNRILARPEIKSQKS